MDIFEAFKKVLSPTELDDNGNKKKKPLTWADIKDYANSLSDEELKQPVRYCGEYKGGEVYSIYILNDDFINPSGDGIEPRSYYAESEDPDDREMAESEPIVLPKGSILLDVDF